MNVSSHKYIVLYTDARMLPQTTSDIGQWTTPSGPVPVSTLAICLWYPIERYFGFHFRYNTWVERYQRELRFL